GNPRRHGENKQTPRREDPGSEPRSPAIPIFFKKELQHQQFLEGSTATLRCELSRPAPQVEWKKAGKLLRGGEKYEMKLKGAEAELRIYCAELEDAGEYSCECGDQKTEARVKINGRRTHPSIHYPTILINQFTSLNRKGALWK
uniref:Ig-like domain-containing protein n=1 Tax=Erpetoichthys calabaricus TaxID=27687 RepID=A0A8C4X3E0_ERPCA